MARPGPTSFFSLNMISARDKPRVLANTFDELENGVLSSLNDVEEKSEVYASFDSLPVIPPGSDGGDIRRAREVQPAIPLSGVERRQGEGRNRVPRFEARHGGGVVCGWGRFVTHCGRNSVLETVAWGVPTVRVPQSTDQQTDARD